MGGVGGEGVGVVAETFLHDLDVDAALTDQQRRLGVAEILHRPDAGEAAVAHQFPQGGGDVVGVPRIAVRPGEDQRLLGRDGSELRSAGLPRPQLVEQLGHPRRDADRAEPARGLRRVLELGLTADQDEHAADGQQPSLQVEVDPAQNWIRVLQEWFPSQRSLVVASVIVGRTPLGERTTARARALVLEWT